MDGKWYIRSFLRFLLHKRSAPLFPAEAPVFVSFLPSVHPVPLRSQYGKSVQTPAPDCGDSQVPSGRIWQDERINPPPDEPLSVSHSILLPLPENDCRLPWQKPAHLCSRFRQSFSLPEHPGPPSPFSAVFHPEASPLSFPHFSSG